MQEKQEKENPHPSRLRGRGVEVSQTLFYFCTAHGLRGKFKSS